MIFKPTTLFSMRNLIAGFLFLPFAFCLLPSHGEAHTFHTSLTRIDYNSEEKTAEITIQVFAHDLEKAIEKRAGKRVNLEKSPDAIKLILAYLSDRFVLKNKTGETKKLTWVGKEQSADSVWLYVETQMPEGFSGAMLANSLFFELANDQVNLVTSRFDGRKTDLSFKPNDKPKSLLEEKVPNTK
jgi:hypothetical protein